MNEEVRSLKIQEIAYECKVEEAMTKDVITVAPDDTMVDVWMKLRDKRISGLPVVSEGNLIGIISVEDFIKCIIQGRKDEQVKDNMTSHIEFIYSDEPLIHVIKKFEKHRFGRFPVKERDTKKLIGIITKGDVIRCLQKRFEKDYYEEEAQKNKMRNIFHDIKSDKTTVILKYDVKGKEFKKAGEKSSFLKNALLRLGITTEITRRIVIASMETEMNIIIFTDGGEITVWVE